MPKPQRKSARRKDTPKKVPVWEAAFLAAFRITGNITLACKAAKIERTTAYDRKRAYPAFAAAWADAQDEAADLLVEEARRRAADGVSRLKFHDGVPIHIQARGPDGTPLVNEAGEPILVPYVEHDYSDTLLIFLLKGARPETYRDNHKVEHSGAVAQVHVYTPTKATVPGG